MSQLEFAVSLRLQMARWLCVCKWPIGSSLDRIEEMSQMVNGTLEF